MHNLNNTLFRTIFCTFCTLLLTCSLSVNAQVLVNTFIDPCSKKVTIFIVPLQGTTLTFMGKSKYITAQDVTSGALMAWVNQVYLEYLDLLDKQNIKLQEAYNANK